MPLEKRRGRFLARRGARTDRVNAGLCQQKSPQMAEKDLLGFFLLKDTAGGGGTQSNSLVGFNFVILIKAPLSYRMWPSEVFEFMQVLSVYACGMCGKKCTSVYVLCIHPFYVHVPSGNTFSASLLVGPGDIDMKQPHLFRAVG